MSNHLGPHRTVKGAHHPNQPSTSETVAEVPTVLEDTLNRLLGIMTKVATGDFSEKPEIDEGEDALSRFVVAFRFLIDDLERAHMQREREIERLRELDHMKTQFINLAAHELNTPLTPIRIHLHMLKRRQQEQPDPAQGSAIDALDRNLTRLGRSVNDLLDVARLQNQGLRIETKTTDLAQVTRTVADDFRPTAEDKQIRFDVALPRSVALTIDEDRITQVLYNLLTNAYKFTPEEGHIRLSLVEHEDHVVVSITDDGAGLDGDQMGRLFRPFSQVHTDEQRVVPGTGLGLFISKGIVEAHGGRLWCDSAGQGQGARFAFMLPKRPPGDETAATPAPTAPPGRQNP